MKLSTDRKDGNRLQTQFSVGRKEKAYIEDDLLISKWRIRSANL